MGKTPGGDKGGGRGSSNIHSVEISYTAYNLPVTIVAKKKKGRGGWAGAAIQGATPTSNNDIFVFYVKVTLFNTEFLKPKHTAPTWKTFIPSFKKQILNHKTKS